MTFVPQTSFTAGEVSPLLYGHVDLNAFRLGLGGLHGFQVLPWGGVSVTPGTIFVSEVKNSADQTRLIEFEYNTDQAYILEFGNYYVRFYTQNGRIEPTPGVPLEVVTPYSSAEVMELGFLQSANTLYLLHKDHPVSKLTRNSLTSFTFSNIIFRKGPFRAENTDTSHTMQANGKVSTITLISNKNFFDAGHVGALIQLGETDNPPDAEWLANTTVTASQTRWAGNVYKASVTGIDSGPNPPTHKKGSLIAGYGKPAWTFLHDGAGIVEITAINNPQSALATVITRLPDDVVSGPTKYWAEGAWSKYRGFPSTGVFHNQRFSLARHKTDLTGVWQSKIGSFEDFKPDTKADDAVSYGINSKKQNAVEWLASGDGMAIGTSEQEFIVSGATSSEPIKPEDINIRNQTSEGSSPVPPLTINNAHIFVSRSGFRLHEFTYSLDRRGHVSPDISLLAEHITGPGVDQLVWQQEPWRTIWARRLDGIMAAITYRREQNVVGASTVDFGFVESTAVTQAVNNKSNELWMIVKRTINGQTKRYIERHAQPWRSRTGEPIETAVYSNSALIYDGAPTDTLSGLDHLEGETVRVLGDGAVMPDQVVVGGSITLPVKVSKAVVGLRAKRLILSLPLHVLTTTGPSSGRMQRIKRFIIRFHETWGGEIGMPGQSEPYEPVNPSGGQDMDVPPAFYAGSKSLPFPAGWDRDPQWEYRHDLPLPATILSATPWLEVGAS